MSKSIIVIPSRMAATRLPGKPMLKINGVSLINHVYKKACKANIAKVIVATGDKIIFDEVKKYGGTCVLTYNNHKTGTDRICEAINKIKIDDNDYVINLQGDEPMIDINDIRKLNDQAKLNNLDMCTLACKLSKKKDLFNKSVVKVKTENSLLKNNISNAQNFFRFSKSKITNNIYHHIGIYIYKYEILKKIKNLKQTTREKRLKLEQIRALENQIQIGVILSKNKSIGLDTIRDYKKIKNLMEFKNY